MVMISIGDAELSVDEAGMGAALMLVSGLGGTAAFWKHQVKPFAEHFRVVTHDHRGTGASTLSKIEYSVSQIAGDTLSLMDAMEIETASMVGHSTGGAVAQYLAINHPDRLEKIVISASWPGPNTYFVEEFKLRQQILEKIGGEAFSIDGVLRGFPPKALFDNPGLLTAAGGERMASFPGVEIMSSRVDAVLGHDQRAGLSQIDIPALVICADDDLVTPSGFSEELAQAIPDAAHVRLPLGGHFVPQITPQEYNDPVLEFLLS